MSSNIANPHISVLFVDDERSNLKGLKANYRRDFTTYLANSADEALAILLENEVHVIVSDQRMPKMTGIELFEQVRQQYPLIVRILLTGYTEVSEIVKAINDTHIFGFMGKPYDPLELKARIEQAYGHYQLRAEKDALLKRYSDVFCSSGDPIVILNENCEVLDANPATERLVEMTVEELKANGCLSLMTEPKKLLKLVRENRSTKAFPRMDISLVTKSGRTIDCLLTLTYSFRGAKHDGQYQAMLMDITDRKEEHDRAQRAKEELEQCVAERTSELKQAIQDLGAFSYSVAHDLRSPLKNIQALSDHLGAMAELPPEHQTRSMVQMMNRGCVRMLALIDDLLRFARTDMNSVDMQKLDLLPIIEELRSELIPMDRMEQVSITTDDLPSVMFDPGMLKVVLSNLISNSIKFTRNEQHAKIHIGSFPSDGSDVILVQDNGVGFAQEDHQQVFETFKRLHRTDQFEGTGIGLSMVSRIMDKMQGEVWAESEPGKGTTIYLRIPRQNAREITNKQDETLRKRA